MQRNSPPKSAGTWSTTCGRSTRRTEETPQREDLPARIRAASQPLGGIEEADLEPLLSRIGRARLVLIGEASHGTSEFYRMRQRITRELLERHRFEFVAAEADWPDAARIDAYVRDQPGRPERAEAAFSRFPTWMWRNHEVLEFVEWLRGHNFGRDAGSRVAFYGLDLYSLNASIGEVLRYLDRVDPESGRLARQRYACLSPFVTDPASYGIAAITDRYRSCEDEVVAMLRDLLAKRGEYAVSSGDRFLDAEQNARIAVNAERYYRVMYYGAAESWNLRDRHMFETLESLLRFHGPDSKAVVWAHNSHLGNAAATSMADRGELNLGQLVRDAYGDEAWIIGFGTDHGTVAAASDWGEPVEVKDIRPAHPRSYEHLCHVAGGDAFLLPLRADVDDDVVADLEQRRLERAIGVIYRPQTELVSHYFEANLPAQFDEYVWFDETTAVTPLDWREHAPELREGHPLATLDV